MEKLLAMYTGYVPVLEQGERGEDSFWYSLDSNQVIFESDADGMVVKESKSVGLSLFLGSKSVTSSCEISLVQNDKNGFDISKVKISDESSDKITLTADSSGIPTKRIDDSRVISAPYSYINIQARYGDYSLMICVGIIVDLSVQDGYFRTTIEGLEAKYTTLHSTVSGNVAKIAEHEGILSVNADRIEAVNKTVQDTIDYASGIDGKVHVLEEKSAGFVTKDDYASLFAEYSKNANLVARSEIAAFITEDEVGNMISVAKISADNIVFNGKFFEVETENLKVTKDGTLESKNGTFENVTASGVFYSKNTATMNEIEINAKKGYFAMRGPTYVDDNNHDIPGTNASVIDIFNLKFDVDPDTLSRIVTMSMKNGNGNRDGIKLDSREGIWIDDGQTNILISSLGIQYTDNYGNVKSVYWEDIINKVKS